MDPWVQQIAVPLAVAMLTSSGLWALVSKRADKNDAERKMLVGLAHDRIIHLGMAYVREGTLRRTSMKTSMTICISHTKRWAATAVQKGSWRK